MNSLILLGQNSEMSPETQFLNLIGGEALAAVTIIAVIGSVLITVVLIGCITSTIQRVLTVRQSNRLIMELVQRGYSADEIERVAYGNSSIGHKVGRIVRDARSALRPGSSQMDRMPSPPVKSAV